MKYLLASLLALAVLSPAFANTDKATKPVADQAKVDKRSFDYHIPPGLQQTADSEARLQQWFTDAKFGAFIHFGIPSKLAGMYKDKVSGHRYGEWIYFSERIPAKDYRKLATTFNPDQFNVVNRGCGCPRCPGVYLHTELTHFCLATSING